MNASLLALLACVLVAVRVTTTAHPIPSWFSVQDPASGPIFESAGSQHTSLVCCRAPVTQRVVGVGRELAAVGVLHRKLVGHLSRQLPFGVRQGALSGGNAVPVDAVRLNGDNGDN